MGSKAEAAKLPSSEAPFRDLQSAATRVWAQISPQRQLRQARAATSKSKRWQSGDRTRRARLAQDGSSSGRALYRSTPWMLCDNVWTGALQYRINTIGGTTANVARRSSPEKVRCPTSATTVSAHTHPAEIVAFMYTGSMIQLYRVAAVADVLNW